MSSAPICIARQETNPRERRVIPRTVGLNGYTARVRTARTCAGRRHCGAR